MTPLRGSRGPPMVTEPRAPAHELPGARGRYATQAERTTMRGKGAVLIGLMALALPAFAQQPSAEPEDQQPERVVRRSSHSIYGPYYVLDENGEPTGEVREGMGRMDESWGPSYGSYGASGAYGSYGY